jgi:outer membrane protein TolC
VGSGPRARKGDEREIERGLHLNLARLITSPLLTPLARTLAERQLAATRADVATRVLMHAADTRRAWVLAVAAEETLRYTAQVLQAAETSAELARRMAQVGNFNTLQRLREQGFAAEAALQHARAQARRDAARERLTRQLGLWGDAAAAYQLPTRLPDLPAAPHERPHIESEAIAQRLDVRGAVLGSEALAAQLGLTQRTRWLNVLELGLKRNSSNEGPSESGWEISLELPIFDSGQARLARAEALHRQSLQRVAEVAIQARSEAREAYGAYRHAWDIARHQRDELVPLARQVSDENLLRYNGMLIGVFDLLADARAQIGAVNAAIDGLREFWLAEAELRTALIGKPTLLGALPAAASGAAMPAGGSDPH